MLVVVVFVVKINSVKYLTNEANNNHTFSVRFSTSILGFLICYYFSRTILWFTS